MIPKRAKCETLIEKKKERKKAERFVCIDIVSHETLTWQMIGMERNSIVRKKMVSKVVDISTFFLILEKREKERAILLYPSEPIDFGINRVVGNTLEKRSHFLRIAVVSQLRQCHSALPFWKKELCDLVFFFFAFYLVSKT